MVALKSSDLGWNNASNKLSESLAGLIPIYSDETTVSLQLSEFVAYPAHLVQLNATESQNSSTSDGGHTFLWFLSVGIAQLGLENEDFGVDDCVSVYGLASSEVEALDELILQTS